MDNCRKVVKRVFNCILFVPAIIWIALFGIFVEMLSILYQGWGGFVVNVSNKYLFFLDFQMFTYILDIGSVKNLL